MTREEAAAALENKTKVKAKAYVKNDAGETIEQYKTGIIEDTRQDWASIAWDTGGHSPCNIGEIMPAD